MVMFNNERLGDAVNEALNTKGPDKKTQEEITKLVFEIDAFIASKSKSMITVFAALFTLIHFKGSDFIKSQELLDIIESIQYSFLEAKIMEDANNNTEGPL